MEETASPYRVKRALLACRDIRVACWKGTKKRTAKKQVWAQPGVDENGFCVLRCFKSRDGDEVWRDFYIRGKKIELQRIANVKDNVFQYGLTLKGQDLCSKPKADEKPLSDTLYLYSTTSREDSLISAAITVLSVSALEDGMCQFYPDLVDTFSRDPEERMRSNSNRSLSSVGSASTGKRLSSILKNPFSLRSKSKRDSVSSISGSMSVSSMPSNRTVGEASTSSVRTEPQRQPQHQQTPVQGRSQSFSKMDRDAWYNRYRRFLTTIVQCSWYLLNFPHLESVVLFQNLGSEADDEAKTLFNRLNGKGGKEIDRSMRASLAGSSADVVADVAARSLYAMQPGVIFDEDFHIYQVAINRQTGLGLDPSLSPAAAAAASHLLASLPVQNVFVIREFVAFLKAVVGENKMSIEECSAVLAPMFVSSVRRAATPSERYPFGVAQRQDAQVFKALLETMIDGLSGQSMFDSCLTVPNADALISDLTATIPEDKDQSEPSDNILPTGPGPNQAKPSQDAAALDTDELPAMWGGENRDDETPSPLRVRPAENSRRSFRDEKPNTNTATDYAALARSVNLNPDMLDHASKAGLASVAVASGASLLATPTPTTVTSNTAEKETATANTTSTSRAEAAVNNKINKAPPVPPSIKIPLPLDEKTEESNGGGAQTKKRSREDSLRRMILWYQSRLNAAPNARNASLWEREIRELSRELRHLEGKPTRDGDSEMYPEDDDDSPGRVRSFDVELISNVAKLWDRSQQSSVEMLMRKKHENGANGNDRESQLNQDPYLESPLTTLETSDALLERLLMDVNSLGTKFNAQSVDVVSPSGHPRSPVSGLYAPTSKIRDLPSLLVGLLQENIQLRVELNEFQRELVQKTQEKMQEFNQAFKDHQALEQNMQQPPQPPVTSTWQAFTNLFPT